MARISRSGLRDVQKYSHRQFITTFLVLLWIMSVESLLTTTTPSNRVIVVGKVIIDEYGKPGEGPVVISIGGGGPQAAFGAALALAVLSNDDTRDPPAKQPVTFVGPVGDDWTDSDAVALETLLGAAIESIELIKGPGLRTPRIQLWHDDDQCIQWRALYDSFGPSGADSLWENRPSASDMISLMGYDESVTCHVIIEGGKKSPGNGGDAQFLHDDAVQKRLSFLGAEPVAFADDESGKVSQEDAKSVVFRLDGLSPAPGIISPDNELYEAVDSSFWNNHEVATRKGPKGSVILQEGQSTAISAATLATPDGTPVNPTGAGNSYSGAITVLRSRGVPLEEAACIASAIGAVFCEYSHIPPWSADVVARVRQAADEVRRKL